MENDGVRPNNWDEYIGQEPLKREFETRIRAANAQSRRLDHSLLIAGPGFGKTSMAAIVASQKGEPFMVRHAPVTRADLAEIVRTFEGILFIDEIHNQPKKGKDGQDMFLPLLEDHFLPISKGRVIEATWLTVVGATTERQALNDSLFDRFEITPDFDSYTLDEMGLIVAGMARKLDVLLPPRDAAALAKASAGTPRQALKLVTAYRDLAVDPSRDRAAPVTGLDALGLLRIDEDGLGVQHYRYLRALADNCEEGTGGLKPISLIMQMKEAAVLHLESLLLEHDLIQYGLRGRTITSNGYRKLNEKAA